MEPSQLQQEVAELNILNPRQRELVENDISNLEAALYGQPYTNDNLHLPTNNSRLAAEMQSINRRPPPQIPEPELVRHNLEMDQITLKRGTAPEYSGHRKNLLYQMYKTEVEKYKEGLLSEGQLWEPTYRHIHQYMRHQEANQRRGKFIENVRRILEPDEEGWSCEALRPSSAAHVDFSLFRDNFETINWTPDDEIDRQIAELDDETYKHFLELKFQTRDASVIMTKLTIDRATYDACEARLSGSLENISDADEQPVTVANASAEEIGRVVEALLEQSGLTYRELLKRARVKAPAIKAAQQEGLITKTGNQYFVSPELSGETHDEPGEIVLTEG